MRVCKVKSCHKVSFGWSMQGYCTVFWQPTIIFIMLDDTSELHALEVEFLTDPANSSLFEEPESDPGHEQEQEHESAAPRKRKWQANKKAVKKKNRRRRRSQSW